MQSYEISHIIVLLVCDNDFLKDQELNKALFYLQSAFLSFTLIFYYGTFIIIMILLASDSYGNVAMQRPNIETHTFRRREDGRILGTEPNQADRTDRYIAETRECVPIRSW